MCGSLWGADDHLCRHQGDGDQSDGFTGVHVIYILSRYSTTKPISLFVCFGATPTAYGGSWASDPNPAVTTLDP